MTPLSLLSASFFSLASTNIEDTTFTYNGYTSQQVHVTSTTADRTVYEMSNSTACSFLGDPCQNGATVTVYAYLPKRYPSSQRRLFARAPRSKGS